jgi:hypothetical protein
MKAVGSSSRFPKRAGLAKELRQLADQVINLTTGDLGTMFHTATKLPATTATVPAKVKRVAPEEPTKR